MKIYQSKSWYLPDFTKYLFFFDHDFIMQITTKNEIFFSKLYDIFPEYMVYEISINEFYSFVEKYNFYEIIKSVFLEVEK